MILFRTLIPQGELELTRQALEKERLHSPGPTSRAEQGPRGEVGVELGEVKWGSGGSRWPRKELLSRRLSSSLGNWVLKPRPASLVPLPVSVPHQSRGLPR